MIKFLIHSNVFKKGVFFERVEIVLYSTIFIVFCFLNSLKIDFVTNYIADKTFYPSMSIVYFCKSVVSFTLIFFIFTFLLRLRSRIFLGIFYLIQSVYLLTHFIYNFYLDSFFHFRQFFLQFQEGISLAHNLAIPFNLKFLVVFIDTPFIFIILFKFIKFSSLLNKHHKITNLLRNNVFLVSIFALIITNIVIQIPYDIKNKFNGEYLIIKKYGLFCNDLSDLLLQSNESSLIKKFNYGKMESISYKEKDMNKIQNVICIQVEELDPKIIHWKYKNEYIAPFLNALSKECIYYPYMLTCDLAGHSSDEEFSVFNNVIPSGRYPSFKLRTYEYPNSIIKQFDKHGFETKAFHGNTGDFYNRSVAYSKMGFQKFYDLNKMGLKRQGWGASDGDLFSFVKRQIQEQKSPFFYYIITISSHEPYTDVRPYYFVADYIDISDKTIRNYFNSISYVDMVLKDFILFIRNNIKDCYVFIYGDHRVTGLKDTSLFDESYGAVPLFIITPDNIAYLEEKSVASFLDIGLTVLNVSGIDFEIYTHGNNLVDYPIKESEIFTREGKLENRTLLFNEAEKNIKNLDLIKNSIHKASVSSHDLSSSKIYPYGTNIQFGIGGNAEEYQGKGWGLPENGYTWTTEKSVTMVLSVEKPKSDIKLIASIAPFTVPEKLTEQRADIYINNNKLHSWSVKSSGEYNLFIPKEYLYKSPLEIRFELPDADSPANLKPGSKDMRILGLMIKFIRLE